MRLLIPQFSQVDVLVVGDVMLDRYWYGDAARISPEAPIPVVGVDATEERPGGAANVALNLAALGARCTLIGVIGDDEAGRSLEAKLNAAGVRCELITLRDWPTIVKLRVISQQQQLLRMDFEQPLSRGHEREMREILERRLESASTLVLEDYDKGTLCEPAALIELAKARGRRVVVDPKLKPFSAYRGADVLKPNRIEFHRASGGWSDHGDFVRRAASLAARHEIEALVITRGSEGLTVVHRDGRHQHIPARVVDVFDEAGAGDTVAAALGAALAAGCTLEEAAALANLAASLVVAKLGTATVTAPELRRALQLFEHGDRGVLTQPELEEVVRAARAQGQRLVFTNGCFDILHSGHVGYLEEARALGDRLIVAVNDDASVRRLKGEGRPVNALERRMKVLSGLAAVDWVVAFGEDTPRALLGSLRPDVLVKGGDYDIDEVVGAEVVRAYGGEVRVLSRIDDASTSAIVERLQRSRQQPLSRR